MVQNFRRAPCCLFLSFVLVCLSNKLTWSSFAPADTVIVNARIYTVNPQRLWAEALAIQADKIIAVGTAKDIAAYRGAGTKVIDAGGRLVLPGFVDSHIHFLEGSLNAQEIVINASESLSELLQQVKAYATNHPEKKWILGQGWTYPMFGAAALPDKKYLDEVISDRPVYLEAFDGHSWWANSRALHLAGITRQTPDPAGGVIVRDSQSGEPTGAIKEDTADAIVERAIPLPTREDKLRALRYGLKKASRVGIV